MTKAFYEVNYPLASAHADSETTAVTSSYVSLADYHRATLVIDVGDMAQGATFDCLLNQATSTAGASAKAISGKAITQLTQAGGDGNQLLVIELRTEELDVNNGFDCVAFVATPASAAVEFSCILYGCEPRFAPTPTTNWEEIVD